MEPRSEKMSVLNDQGKIAERDIRYAPGLYKIFDEILVGAAENKHRCPDKIEVMIDAKANLISVKNNAKGNPYCP